MPQIKIRQDGSVLYIFDDDIHALFSEHGSARVTRASDVEPTEDGRWQAHMRDGVSLPPQTRRSAALKAEVKYLEGTVLS